MFPTQPDATARTDRSNDWVQLSNVRASVSDFVTGIDHAGRLDVSIPPGTLRIERNGAQYDMRLFGRGGGFCWSQVSIDKARVCRYIQHYAADNTIELRRVDG